jgi:hypothetical protein
VGFDEGLDVFERGAGGVEEVPGDEVHDRDVAPMSWLWMGRGRFPRSRA